MSALKVLARTQSLIPNLTVPLGASGGTGPYTFSMVQGSKGLVNPTTGVYTSAPQPGQDVVQVADSLGATATLQFFIGTPLQLICDIIRHELGLDPDQSYLWDQKFNIPNDSRVYVPVGVLSCKPFGNTNSFDPDLGQVQSINMSATLSLDIMSRSIDGVNRKEEVLMALKSFYSESQQEMNSFRIFNISTNFVNLSDVEGAAILYRFNISVNVQYMVIKTNVIPYYDDFPGAVVEQVEP